MATLFSYIKKHKDIPFEEENMTIIDALIFTGVIYLPLPQAPSDNFRHEDSIGYLLQKFIDHPTAYKSCVMPLTDLKFARTLVKANRYKDIKIFGYYESINDSEQKQFRASTFVKNDNSQIFVSYCGTDTTLVGWKEDFNLSYKKQVPSQLLAVEYLNHIGENFPNCDIYIGGHSKGGNLAMYAATFCNDEVKKRIKYCFNFDGPGLIKEDKETPEYQLIRKRIITIIPNYSIVGVIFGFSDDYRIIKSFGLGVYNHAYYYWQIKDNDFYYSKKISALSAKTAVLTSKAYNELSSKEKQIFMDTVYKMMTAGGATTTHAINKNISQFIQGMSDTFILLDPETKKKITRILFDFGSNYLRPMNALEKGVRKHIEMHANKK